MAGRRGQLRYAYKGRPGSTFGDDRYVTNKVDRHLLHLILNSDF